MRKMKRIIIPAKKIRLSLKTRMPQKTTFEEITELLDRRLRSSQSIEAF